jgi:hypothetical protein
MRRTAATRRDPAGSDMMALNFPNAIRRFEAGRSCVSFWGSDASLEVAFQIDLEALRKLAPARFDNQEATALGVFDDNRETIQKAARTLYGKRRTGFCRLTVENFA